MGRILIAGCGYVGQATAVLFQEAGWQIEGWTSSKESAQKLSGEPYPIAAVDLSQRDQIAARSGDFDGVIHCASSGGGGAGAYRTVYLEGARNLLEFFPQTPLLFTSSTSVYAQADGSWVTEESATEPVPQTGRILRETEELVLAHGGLVARLAGIYGPGRSFLLQKFLEGSAVADKEADRFINQAHRDDIAAALFLLLNMRMRDPKLHRASSPDIFNVVDDEPVLQSEFYGWLAAHLGRSTPGQGVENRTGKRGYSNKRVSNAKLRSFGWKLRYPTFREAMKNSILPRVHR